MAFFDATLFTVVPRLYRALDGALDPPTRLAARPGAASDSGRTGTRPPRVGPYLRWGSWIGGDRDGNPEVTADVTERTLRIQADHVLHGYEAVATRLMQTLAAATSGGSGRARRWRSRLARDAEDLPETDRQLRRRFPDEPYRQRFGFIAERLRRTRAALTGEAAPRRAAGTRTPPSSTPSWPSSRTRSSPTASSGSRGARSPTCAGRSARSGSTSRRSRSASTPPCTGPRSRRSRDRRRPAPIEVVRRACRSTRSSPRSGRSRAIQARFGVEACHRVVVSFTASASDVTDVLELARLATRRRAAGPRRRAALRVLRGARRRPARSSRRCSTTRPIAPTSRRAAIGRR